MPVLHALLRDNGADGPNVDYGAIARAMQQDKLQPYYAAYEDDQNFFQPIVHGLVLTPGLPQPLADSYRQFLPPLTRQQMPGGYPMQNEGFYLNDSYFPRIVSAEYGNDQGQLVSWTYPNVDHVPWSETLLKAFPWLKTAPRTGQATVAAFIADPHTSVVQHDSTGEACGWFNSNWGVYLSYAPHLLFDQELRAGKIFADPTAQYWQSAYNGWNEESAAVGARNFIEAVVVAVAAAYVIGAAGIDGSASAAGGGAGAGGGAAAGNAVSDEAAGGAITQPIATSGDLVAANLAPVAAPGAGAGGVSALLTSVGGAVGTDLIKAGASLSAAEILAGTKPRAPAPAPAANTKLPVNTNKPSSTTQASTGYLVLLLAGALAAGIIA